MEPNARELCKVGSAGATLSCLHCVHRTWAGKYYLTSSHQCVWHVERNLPMLSECIHNLICLGPPWIQRGCMDAQCRSAALNSGIDDIPLSASWPYTEEPWFPHLQRGKIYYSMELLEWLVNQCREDLEERLVLVGTWGCSFSSLTSCPVPPGICGMEVLPTLNQCLLASLALQPLS